MKNKKTLPFSQVHRKFKFLEKLDFLPLFLTQVTSQVSCVRCHVSSGVCHIFIDFLKYKMVDGLLSTGPTPSSFM